MTREEHKKAVNQLLGMIAAEHQAAASELLTNLSDDFNTTQNEIETANGNVQSLTKDNEALRAANMKLFLRVGETDKQIHGQDKPNPSHGKTEEDKPLPFDDLFNEKGELI